MLFKKIKFILIIIIFYQTASYSKSSSFNDNYSKNLSKYFSGIMAFQNKDNSKALDFFNSSKNLITEHDPFLKKYIYSLVLDNKITKAINIIKSNKLKNNSNFFDAYLLLIVDNLKKNNLDQAYKNSEIAIKQIPLDRFNLAILESLQQLIFTFKEKEIIKEKNNYGKLTFISETFQKCYLSDEKTDSYFKNLYNDKEADYTRYIFFYLSYLIENNRLANAEEITDDLEYINTSLLLSQGKSWIENNDSENIVKIFSCKNSNDIVSEFLFLISNLYSSQENYNKSNFFLNISYFLNPKFKFNLSLVAENQYLNKEYKKAKKTIKIFDAEDQFYYWYRIKKEAQIILKQKSKQDSLTYIKDKFNKIEKKNNKFFLDIANFYRNLKEYKDAIKYYTKILDTLDEDSEIKSDILYRRGGSYERLGVYEKADEDLLNSLRIYPDDAYVLNYLAYSWLERNEKINEAINMLEKAYSLKRNDPYIIDSIGWAYYLIDDYLKAEKLLKRAVELMPDDPIVNDHYGDILWKLNQKIQARYFWSNVLKMESVDKEIIEKINIKLVQGIKDS